MPNPLAEFAGTMKLSRRWNTENPIMSEREENCRFLQGWIHRFKIENRIGGIRVKLKDVMKRLSFDYTGRFKPQLRGNDFSTIINLSGNITSVC